ncbi:MAG TPA: hypothetical protein VK869_09795 [Rubrobacteraceae bacterium]|nr:hypothetical protein [Rubrobacteraceae bacterium]
MTFIGSVAVGVFLAKLGLEAAVKQPVLASCEARVDLPERPVWRRAWSEAWAFFVPVIPYLLVGTTVGALPHGFVPTGWIVALARAGQPMAIPMAAALGVPFYVDVEAIDFQYRSSSSSGRVIPEVRRFSGHLYCRRAR